MRANRIPIRTLVLAALTALSLVGAARADAYIYWGNQTLNGSFPGAIGRANLDGTNINNTFISGGNGACGPAVNGTHVYWGQRDTARIGRANLDGSGVNLNFISTGSSLPCGGTVNSTHVFWANGGLASSIGRANLDGTNVNNTFITGADDPNGVAVNSTHIFWASGNSDRSVGRANLDGTGVNETFIPVGDDVGEEVRGVAVNSTHVFWGDRFNDRIGRANLDGTNVDLDFFTANGVCGVAVSDTHIYWANQDDNSIGRANLDGTGVNQTYIDFGNNAPCGVALDALPNTTGTTVSCTPSTVVVAQASTCTATVVDSSATPTTPTGDVDFTSNGSGAFSASGTCTLAPVNSTTASCNLTYTPSAIGTGSHTITGSYEGDNGHTADDGAFLLTVDGRDTQSTLSCSPSSVFVSEQTTCTATVDDVDPDGTKSAPGGAVGVSAEGPGAVASSPCTLAAIDADSSSCQVTYTPSGIGDGTHTLTASYGASGPHKASSDTFDVAVARRGTAATLTCNPSAVDVLASSTCTIALQDQGPVASASPPAGTVTYSIVNGPGTLEPPGTCILSQTGVGSSSCELDYAPNGVGTGTHTVNASFPDSAVHATSNDDADMTVSKRASGTTVACAPPSVTIGEATTCTATVEDQGAGGGPVTPAGSISFTSDTSGGTFSGGAACTLSGPAGSSSSCSVTYTPGQTGSGTHAITADYSGSGTHDVGQAAAPVKVSEGKLSVLLDDFYVVKSSFPITCSLSAGELKQCSAAASSGGAAAAGTVAQGSAAGDGSGSTRVALRLSKRGKRLVRSSLGGLKVDLRATGTGASGKAVEATGATTLVARRQSIAPNGSMFGPFSSELTAGGKRFLRGVAAELAHVKSIRCEGHTASTQEGGGSFTEALGLARARAACAYLKKLGVKATFSAVSQGKRNPRAPNGTRRGRALNRRVALTILHG